MIDFQNLIKKDYEKWYDEDYIFEKTDGFYKAYKFGQFIEDVIYLSNSLLDMGLKGKKIIIFGENSKKWLISDLAVMAYVGISIGVSKESDLEDISNIIKFLNADALIYSKEKEDIVKRLKKEVKDIAYISMDEDLDELIEKGRVLSKGKKSLFDFEKIREDECVNVVFTSGTTSRPKAVMLSEKNIFFGWESLKKRAYMDKDDKCYLFLPLHHTYAGIYNFVYSLISGMKLYLSTGIVNIEREILEVKPTVFCAVPYIYNKIYEKVKEDTKVLNFVFGGNIKYLFCGGAPISEEVRKAYKMAGLDFLVAYALSETASSFAIEYSKSRNNSSVGVVFEDIDVRIEDKDENGIGEIVVRGDNVFLGYMNDDEATKKAFNDSGFFKTGDLGYIDEERNLYITGRKKKILLTDKGENICIDEVKEKIMKDDENINDVKLYIQENKLKADIYVKKEVQKDYEQLLIDINKNLKSYEKIEKFKIIKDKLDKRLKQ